MPHTGITTTITATRATDTPGQEHVAATGQVGVETSPPQLWVPGLTGRPDRPASVRVLRLLEPYLEPGAANHIDTARVVIALSAATSFERGGPGSLCHAADAAAGRGSTS